MTGHWISWRTYLESLLGSMPCNINININFNSMHINSLLWNISCKSIMLTICVYLHTSVISWIQLTLNWSPIILMRHICSLVYLTLHQRLFTKLCHEQINRHSVPFFRCDAALHHKHIESSILSVIMLHSRMNTFTPIHISRVTWAKGKR